MTTTAANPAVRAVLLVDDEPQSCKWFGRTFADEFRVLTAHSVDAALALLQASGDEIAVLVTDYRMPVRNGLELLALVRRQYRHLVPLLCTAYADKELAIRAVNEGRVFRIIEKPLDEPSTRQALRDALALYQLQAQEREQQAQRAMAIRETLGFLAHELNTPLATVRGNMGALRDRYRPDAGLATHAAFLEHQAGEVIAAIDAAERRTLYCQALVNTFVQSARDAHPSLLSAEVGAGALVRSLLDSYPFDGEERDWVACRVLQDFRLPGRRDLLYLVLCTLTKNALQALRGQAAPSVHIEIGRTAHPTVPARTWLRVVDNGPGIAPELLSRLTHEPVTTRADAGGHGMGLLFCRRVMQAAGGSIDIQSTPGQGTSVALYFPETDEARAP